MSWITELYIAKLKIPKDKKYSKSLSFEDIKEYLEIRSHDKNYENYIKPGILYFTEDLNTLARELGVDKVCPKGLFIEGIYGGEKKKGEEEYAGLIVIEHSLDNMVFKFKLHNTKSVLVVPVNYLTKYGVKVYKMIYVGEINPFKITRYLDIILSQRGECFLREFLREALRLNERSVSPEDRRKIEKLISELQQPGVITTLDTSKHYVVYRRIRAFTASIFKPIANNFIVKDEVGYIECRDESIAYYYVAILNYLAFKVIEAKRSFIRTQYARPLLALHIAGLSWNNVNGEIREKIVSLSKRLHEKAPSKEYANQKVALKEIARLPEFKEIVEILNSNVDKENLEIALNMVSGKGVEE